jgi:hypothetical protein
MLQRSLLHERNLSEGAKCTPRRTETSVPDTWLYLPLN